MTTDNRSSVIIDFEGFCSALLACSFSLGGGNDKGIFALIPYTWENQDGVDSPVKWHTGDPVTDPWEWRMRVLEERQDIAYSKVFFKTSGYITAEWYPYFLSVRRHGEFLEEAYEYGTVSSIAKEIYDIISTEDEIPYHEIKAAGGFTGADNTRFDRAITELQMRMFITMCGRAQKVNKYGEKYGWNSTVFTTVESFWCKRNVTLPDYDLEKAYGKIKRRVLELNNNAR